MKQYRNWDAVQAAGEFKKLEAGGYVIKIKAVREEMSKNNNPMLVIAFDIAEGDCKGYYNDIFTRDETPQKKWPNNGIHRIMLPADDGTEEDNKKMSRLKGFISAVAESNPNYNPNKYYDIAQLNNKLLGGIFRREEYETQTGERKWSTKLAWTCSVQKVRNGEFTVPEDKPLPEQNNVIYGGFPQAPTNSYSTNPYASSPLAQDDPFGSSQDFAEIDNISDEELPFF